MIKPTRNTINPILKERLKNLLVVRHLDGESIDSDLTVWNRRKHFLNQGIFFLDLSTDDRFLLIREKWGYEGIAKMIPEMPINEIKRGYYREIDIDDYRNNDLSIENEIERRINYVIHILNFMHKNRARGVMYEIYEYMFGVVKDAERIFKLK